MCTLIKAKRLIVSFVQFRQSQQRYRRDLWNENTDTFYVFSYFFLRQTLEEMQGEGLGHREFLKIPQPTAANTWERIRLSVK